MLCTSWCPSLGGACGRGPVGGALSPRVLQNCHDDAAKFVHLLVSPGCSYLGQVDFVPFLQVRARRPRRAPSRVSCCAPHAALPMCHCLCSAHPLCPCPPHACPVSAARIPPPSGASLFYTCVWEPGSLPPGAASAVWKPGSVPSGGRLPGWPRAAPREPCEQWDGVDSSTPEPGSLDSDRHRAVRCQAVTDRVRVCRTLIPNAFLLPLAQFVQDFMLHSLEESLK